MFGKYLALGAAAAMFWAVPALAMDDGQPASKAKDPNQVVCEKIEVLGSRVSTKRVCMTRSEWAEKRRLERMEIDRAQVGRAAATGASDSLAKRPIFFMTGGEGGMSPLSAAG